MELSAEQILRETSKISIDPKRRGQLGERYVMVEPKVQVYHHYS